VDDSSPNTGQRLLRESVERFVEREYPFDRRRALAASPEGFSRETWGCFADLGWLAAPLPEAYVPVRRSVPATAWRFPVCPRP